MRRQGGRHGRSKATGSAPAVRCGRGGGCSVGGRRGGRQPVVEGEVARVGRRGGGQWGRRVKGRGLGGRRGDLEPRAVVVVRLAEIKVDGGFGG